MLYQLSVCRTLFVAMCLSFGSAYSMSPERDGAYPKKEHISLGKGKVVFDRIKGWKDLRGLSILYGVTTATSVAAYFAAQESKSTGTRDDAIIVSGSACIASFAGLLPFLIYLDHNLYEDMGRAEEVNVERGLDERFPHSVRVTQYDTEGNVILDKQAAQLTRGEFDLLSSKAQEGVREALAGHKRSAVYYTYYWRPICITKNFDDYLFGDVQTVR